VGSNDADSRPTVAAAAMTGSGVDAFVVAVVVGVVAPNLNWYSNEHENVHDADGD